MIKSPAILIKIVRDQPQISVTCVEIMFKFPFKMKGKRVYLPVKMGLNE